MTSSNLLACYEELATGVPLEALYQKYVKADVVVTLELFERRIKLQQLAEFIQARDGHLAKMRREVL